MSDQAVEHIAFAVGMIVVTVIGLLMGAAF